MEPKRTELPTPHAGEREKGTREDGEAMPPQAEPKAAGTPVKPESNKGSGGPPPEDIGREPSPSTADDEMGRRGDQLDGIEGLSDNKAGG